MISEQFKVWATIERQRYDEDDPNETEEHEDMNVIPAKIGQFDTLKEAEAFLVSMDPVFGIADYNNKKGTND